MLLPSLEDLLDLMASTNLYHCECRCIAGNWKVTDIGKKNQKPMLDKGGGDCTHLPPTEAFYMQINTGPTFLNLLSIL